ncbi:MAG: Acetolactate synthase small subunit, partial [uncultured Pseudonocardia sp.]
DHRAPHPVRPRRGQARRARPRLGPVLPARVQHLLARRRTDRAPGRLADDHRRRRRGPAARAGHQAAQQAGARHQDRGAGARGVRAARAPAGEGARRRGRAQPGAGDREPVPGQRRGRHPRGPDDRGHGHGREDHRAAQEPGALRHPGDGAVRHHRRRPWAALHHRHRSPL